MNQNYNINDIWTLIVKNQGANFETITGKTFTYSVIENSVVPDRTKYPITKKNFEIALQYLPLSGPGQITKLCRGSSYIYAILMDKRILNKLEVEEND